MARTHVRGSALASAAATLALLAGPLLVRAQTNVNSPGTTLISSDFESDVSAGEASLKNDAAGAKLQVQVIDAEDQAAGDEGDANLEVHASMDNLQQDLQTPDEQQNLDQSEVDSVDDSSDLSAESDSAINLNEESDSQLEAPVNDGTSDGTSDGAYQEDGAKLDATGGEGTRPSDSGETSPDRERGAGVDLNINGATDLELNR